MTWALDLWWVLMRWKQRGKQMTSAKNDMTFGLETNLTVILSSFHCRKVYCSQYKEFLQQYEAIQWLWLPYSFEKNNKNDIYRTVICFFVNKCFFSYARFLCFTPLVQLCNTIGATCTRIRILLLSCHLITWHWLLALFCIWLGNFWMGITTMSWPVCVLQLVLQLIQFQRVHFFVLLCAHTTVCK